MGHSFARSWGSFFSFDMVPWKRKWQSSPQTKKEPKVTEGLLQLPDAGWSGSFQPEKGCGPRKGGTPCSKFCAQVALFHSGSITVLTILHSKHLGSDSTKTLSPLHHRVFMYFVNVEFLNRRAKRQQTIQMLVLPRTIHTTRKPHGKF